MINDMPSSAIGLIPRFNTLNETIPAMIKICIIISFVRKYKKNQPTLLFIITIAIGFLHSPHILNRFCISSRLLQSNVLASIHSACDPHL